MTPQDNFAALKEFNHAYDGTKTAVEDMHLEYQALLQADPDLGGAPRSLPPARSSAAASARRRACAGVFFCYALPALDKEKNEFTEEAGTTRWYLYDLDRETILEEPGEIGASISSGPTTPRKCVTEEKPLIETRSKIEKHIKNTYLKRVQAPTGTGPSLKAWMELN